MSDIRILNRAAMVNAALSRMRQSVEARKAGDTALAARHSAKAWDYLEWARSYSTAPVAEVEVIVRKRRAA